VTSQTMIPPALDEQVLEQLEAEFLRSPIGFWPLRSETSLPASDIPPAPGRPVEDDPQAKSLYKTNQYCCAG
jgi:hypothetical protein